MEAKWIDVFLFKAPDCIRGWLAYLRNENNRYTLKVSVKSENGSKAKNKAITLANKDFSSDDLKILKLNFSDNLWGVNNFPQLKEKLKTKPIK